LAIRAVYIIKDTGFALFHKNYNNGIADPDEDLIGGFISAIYTFFKDYCEDQIMKMETKLLKFFYHLCEEVIFVIITELENDEDETLITKLLRTLAENFVYKFGVGVKEEINRSKFSDFEKIADQLIEEYNKVNNKKSSAKSSLEAMDNFVKNTIHKILVYDSLSNK
jgi:hypothetical protein